ncbi:MAG: class I SAM-dependent methyltransferase [Anaerolineales bacterium]
MNNVQTFSQRSDQYAKNRPQYPDELFFYLSEISPTHSSAWDCATGNGQAAVSLAGYFAHVEATDFSAEQIGHAIPHPKVRYSLSPAEQTPFEKEAFDLVTVATAFHWFDQPKFFQEVDRVLKPMGVLTIWSYGFFSVNAEIDTFIDAELYKPIDPFWAEGNRQMFRGYSDVSFPFDAIQDLPTFSMKMDWDLGQLLAFLQTWSAVKRYTVERGINPVDEVEPRLRSLWGDAETIKAVKMPLILIARRKP